ncbi:hypothetical protein [Rubritalea tangerina]|uniref:hypothetical protein n=1 Tax=Rubritalea tangerina TaxID=430798 RepID=UPI00361936A2
MKYACPPPCRQALFFINYSYLITNTFTFPSHYSTFNHQLNTSNHDLTRRIHTNT